MDVVIVSFALRAVGATTIATLLGFAFWVLGAVIVASFWVNNAAGSDLNAIFSFGIGAGIAGWMSWRGRLSDWRRWVRMLPIAVFSGLLFTWIGLNNFGHTLIGGSAIGGVDGVQALPGIAPVTGAWLGAMLGAFIPFGLLALVRGFRGIEP